METPKNIQSAETVSADAQPVQPSKKRKGKKGIVLISVLLAVVVLVGGLLALWPLLTRQNNEENGSVSIAEKARDMISKGEYENAYYLLRSAPKSLHTECFSDIDNSGYGLDYSTYLDFSVSSYDPGFYVYDDEEIHKLFFDFRLLCEEFTVFDENGEKVVTVEAICEEDNGRIIYITTDGSGQVVNSSKFEYEDGYIKGEAYSYSDYEDGQIQQKQSSSEYKYDDAGNKISYISYDGDGNIEGRGEYKYDDAGNQISYISYDDNGNIDYRVEYEYDEKGNHINTLRYGADGSFLDSNKYKYDRNGNIVSDTSYDENGSTTRSIEYTYDKDGRLTDYIRYGAYGKVTEQKEYKYDRAGNRISYVQYGDNGQVDRRNEYQYDNAGNMITYTYEFVRYNSFTYYELEYDASGNRTAYVAYDKEGQVKYRCECTYDENGNPISRVYFDAYGNKEYTEVFSGYKVVYIPKLGK